MGTVRWDSTWPAKNRGSAAATTVGAFHSSGNTTSNASSAVNLDDGAAGAGSEVTFPKGVVLHVTCDELCRLVIGGGTATATSGHLLQPDIAEWIEIGTAGTVSVFDEA